MITVIGLGVEPEDLTYNAQKHLSKADKIFLRTAQTPHAAFLKELGFSFEALDSLYEESEDYEQLCEDIAKTVSSAPFAKVVYACPGSGVIGDETVLALANLCKEKKIPLTLLPGISPADQAIAKYYGTKNLLFLSADQVAPSLLNPRLTLVVEEIDDFFLASQVKLALMEVYQEDTTVYLNGESLPLFALDRKESYDEHTALLIPALTIEQTARYDAEHLMELIQLLRDPVHGCPWEKEATHDILRHTLLEECYEVNQAIEDDDMEALIEELGDVLLQVFLHIAIAQERGEMNPGDVYTGICQKMIARHSHIFSHHKVSTSREMTAYWEEEKRKSNQMKTVTDSMRSIAKSFPALLRAEKVQKKAALVGFDWDCEEDALKKVEEETKEVRLALSQKDAHLVEEEIGDLIFSCVNAARLCKVTPEIALQQASDKFILRFSYVEKELQSRGKALKDASLQEMDALWEEAKKQ